MNREDSHGIRVTDEVQDTAAESLVLVTNHFPFGLYESFLEHELPALTKHFKKVVIVCRDVTSDVQRPVHGATVHRINPVSSRAERMLTAWLCVKHGPGLSRYLREELKVLKRSNRKLNSFIFNDLVHTLVKAVQTSHQLTRIIREENLTGRVVLYSYWLTASALSLTFVRSGRAQIRTLSRAHGGDVYEYRTPHKYLPFRHSLMRKLDAIYAISEDAAIHLRQQADPADAVKVHVSRLGTRDAGVAPHKTARRFTLVSCAFMVPVKRIHLMIDALEQIDQPDIHWIHIGSGPLMDELHLRAKEKLQQKVNITFQFAGAMTNEQLMAFYRTTYVDAFVNTSVAEGIPVTMMEAQSFGIPIIAPRVGGVPEIVNEDTGRLFEADASPLTIATLITSVLEQSPENAQAMRRQARQNWKTHYNADLNFSTFVAETDKL